MNPIRLALAAIFLIGAASLRGEVVRVEIRERTPIANGHSFGATGPYEKITGRMFVEVDPSAPANARICDLALAPRNERGRVECWTDFFLLKPADARRGNRRILYDVNNRGNMLALSNFNDAERTNTPGTLAHAGNGFLLRHGYSVLSCGWNGEVTDDGTQRLLTGVPIATEQGRTITGRAHIEISTTEKVFSRAFSWSPWGAFAAFPTVSLEDREAVLTMRPSRSEPATEVPRTGWAFGRWENETLVTDPAHLYVKDGFRPGWLYDLVYTAKEPRVTGLGLAALRDCVSFLRHAPPERNPLAGAIDAAYVAGISQSGRLIHHFIHEGFNTDEARRAVFDGALIHVAGAGKGTFNHRFRMMTDYGTCHEGNLSGSEFFPLSPVPQTDPVTSERGDTLARARASGHVPKIIFTQTSTEYWSRAASLLHTDVEGRKDIELPPEVRVYLVAGAQHLGAGPHTPGICQQPRSTLNDRGPILRAMLVALDEWVSNGMAPSPSRHPRIADSTLVDLKTWRFPRIPGVNLPARYYEPLRLDFGPRFRTDGIADTIPPRIESPYRTLIPAVDSDGNETGGIRLPEVAVPLGTFTGWNLRAAPFGAEGILSPLDGMYLPFALTADERRQRGDPRPAVRERYSTREVYLARMTDAALQLKRDRFLLDEDVTAILEKAAGIKLWDTP
ncbi:MAG: alpha/beta hydrolase domain-containing protein [Chthoniobacteraceae bacterium]